ncbi:hypothetical protein ACFZA9_15285 [Streptomyces olivaceus]|uniref:hypothetical protein n=1 Tax=Streptomyces olivaceus TaxID=47716 RepID=UPI0036E75ED4
MTDSGAKHAGRAYFTTYRTVGRADVRQAILEALASVKDAGVQVLFASPDGTTPIYVGLELFGTYRIGLLFYPFRSNRRITKNRPGDEHRMQIRYGGESSWDIKDHSLAKDMAGIETTLVVGVDPDLGHFVGLDHTLYDPLPMGISFEYKQEYVEEALKSGWQVYERENVPGTRREEPRSRTGLETVVVFRPDKILHFIHLERRAQRLQLDSPLRYKLAESLAKVDVADLSEIGGSAGIVGRHDLEEAFSMSSNQILDLLSSANRLEVAVRGRVAEWHLEQQLRSTVGLASVEPLDLDGEPDFEVLTASGAKLRIECKNCSPKLTASGDYRVEVQKTRASKGDPTSRYYNVTHFQVVAACLFSVTGKWEFRFKRAESLKRHTSYDHKIAAMQVVDDSWSSDLLSVLEG